jgi:hypothetical protein
MSLFRQCAVMHQYLPNAPPSMERRKLANVRIRNVPKTRYFACQTMPFKAKPGLGAHKDLNQAPSWEDIGKKITPTLLADLRAASPKPPGDAPVRRFFAHAVGGQTPTTSEVPLMYMNSSWQSFTPQAAAMKVAALIGEYIVEHRHMFKNDWSRRTQSAIAAVFTALGGQANNRYPVFDNSLLPTRQGTKTNAPNSLGTLEWPEIAGIRPSQRDEAALELLQSGVVTILEESERIFEFGQRVIRTSSPPPHVNEECWWRIKRYVENVRSILKAGKPLIDGPVDDVNMSSTWVYAGFPKSTIDPPLLEAYSVRERAARCLGSTNRLTAALKVFMCTITGWNKTQIGLLPSAPYAFRYEDDAFGICQAAFLAVFKARAGHFVYAHLDRGSAIQKISREKNFSLWEEAERELGDTAQARIVNMPSALDLLDRYARLTEPLREFDLNGAFKDRFFLSIGQQSLSDTNLNLRAYKLSELLNRDGVSYRTVRQSFVNVVRRATGSLSLSKHLTNNISTGVLLTHYDDPEIQAELDAAVAFWQNCFQALILSENPSLRSYLVISDGDLEWFRSLAIPAGIASSLQIMGRHVTLSERNYLSIERSPEVFQQIYLIRLGVLAARRRIGERRWAAQGIYILAYVIAMRRHLLHAGLIDQYFDTVRTANRMLRDGTIAVPKVMDD